MLLWIAVLAFLAPAVLGAQATCTGCNDGTVSSGTAQDVAGYVSTGTAVAPLATGDFYWNAGLFVNANLTVQDGSGNDVVAFSSSQILFQNATPTTGDTNVVIKAGAGDDGSLLSFENSSGVEQSNFTQNGSRWQAGVGIDLRVRGRRADQTGGDVFIGSVSDRTYTSGDGSLLLFDGDFEPTSGTGTWSFINIDSTAIVNQTGGANGITRGIFINPTLTAAADFRALETSTGKIALGTGTKHDGYTIFDAAEVQTTDATVTVLDTITLLDENTYHVEALVVGVKSDGTDRASYHLAATVYRTGAGSATLQGGITSLHTQESNASWDATFTVSSNDVRVSVTGVAATTVEWGTTLKFINMSN